MTTALMLDSLNVLYSTHRHVAVKIESSWGGPRCDDLLYGYLVKNREDRLGFCPSIYKEIMNLYILHSFQYGSKYSVIDSTKDLNIYVEYV